MSSSIVVCATVVILGVYMWVIDYGIALFQSKIPWKDLWTKLLGGS